MKFSYIIIGAVLVVVAVLAGVFWSKDTTMIDDNQDGTSTVEDTRALAEEVEAILDAKASLVVSLVRDPLIIAEVKKSNEDHRSITLEEIELLDQRWRRSDGMDSFIKPFLTNKVAQRVLSFQEENPGFSEIFVTDEHGLNVGQTNKTTDYYQADEDWWTGAYNAGVGKIFHGPIEFDESAQTEAISIYAPIMDPETERAVGVIKAVLSIAAIKVEL